MSRYEDAETRPDKPDTRNWKKRAPWVAGTMLWGCFGGWVFSQLGIPLAWMIGAMIFTAGAAITGVRLQGPAVEGEPTHLNFKNVLILKNLVVVPSLPAAPEGCAQS